MKIHDNTDAPKVNGYILGDQNHIGFYFKGYVYYFGFSSSKAYPRKTHLQNWCKKWVYLNEMCAEKKEEYMETMGGISDIEPEVFSEMKIEEMGMSLTDDWKAGKLKNGWYFCLYENDAVFPALCFDDDFEDYELKVMEVLAPCDYDHFVELTEKVEKLNEGLNGKFCRD